MGSKLKKWKKGDSQGVRQREKYRAKQHEIESETIQQQQVWKGLN